MVTQLSLGCTVCKLVVEPLQQLMLVYITPVVLEHNFKRCEYWKVRECSVASYMEDSLESRLEVSNPLGLYEYI